jgi:LacI family transcriptional regulator
MRMRSGVQRPVTMRDVARAVGVAQSTVSRALRNAREISAATRTRVLAAAGAMGYRPNPFVAAFTAQVRNYRRAPRGATIAMLDCGMRGAGAYVAGAKERAAALGYATELFRLADFAGDLAWFNRVLDARGILTLLVLPVPAGCKPDAIRFERLACATIDPSLSTPRIPRASPDYFQNMQVALATLTRRGLRRIGYATFQEELGRIGAAWMGAYMGWQAALPPSARLEPYVDTRWQRADFVAWLQRERPQAVISNYYPFADWARETGWFSRQRPLLYVPLNVNVPDPRWAGIDQRPDMVGAAAIDLIVSQVRRNEFGLPAVPVTMLVEGVWRDLPAEGGHAR